MNATAIALLNELSLLEEAIKAPERIITGAARGAMGLTLDVSKTPEWQAARRKYDTYFAQIRRINGQLNKLRKFAGYKNINGKCVATYKYK